MTQLRHHQPILDAIPIRVAVVTFQGLGVAEAYASETNLNWPLLVDSSLHLYSAYGMHRGTWWNVYGPQAWWIYARLLLKGRRLRRLTGDPNQLGGDVLIDPGGIVRLHHVGRGPADRPTVEQILNRVREQQKAPSGD